MVAGSRRRGESRESRVYWGVVYALHYRVSRGQLETLNGPTKKRERGGRRGEQREREKEQEEKAS